MPAMSSSGQPEPPSDWFSSETGRVLLDSEAEPVRQALGDRPGQPWLWLAPDADWQQSLQVDGRGLRLARDGAGWRGDACCGLPLPLPTGSVATVVLQHVLGRRGGDPDALLEEAARVLTPGGRVWLFLLNPLSPYRWRWRGSGLGASEPLPWRRRLRACGLEPDVVSFGVGPNWQVVASGAMQRGPGWRAAYLLRAEKRVLPLTPVRRRRPLRLATGVGVA